MRLLRRLIALAFFGLALAFPMKNGDAIAQQTDNIAENSFNLVQFQRLSLLKLSAVSEFGDFTKPEDLKLSPLSMIEENIARNLNSHWVWPEYTLEMIDSYSPFLFRTKKSQDLNEVKILLEVNSRGSVSGFEVIGDVDKGLKERIDYVLRKLPNCKPVPGYAKYSPERFELIIKK